MSLWRGALILSVATGLAALTAVAIDYFKSPAVTFIFQRGFNGHFYLVQDSAGVDVRMESPLRIVIPASGVLKVQGQPFEKAGSYRFAAQYSDGERIEPIHSLFVDPEKPGDIFFRMGGNGLFETESGKIHYDWGFVGDAENYKKAKGYEPDLSRIKSLLSSQSLGRKRVAPEDSSIAKDQKK